MRDHPTPPNITKLGPYQVFVFGSNEAGRHGKGAALTAKKKFGASSRQAFGLSGQSFAIPTKDEKLKTLRLVVIGAYVNVFIMDARELPHHEFFVTEIGCGLAGYTPEEIAPYFRAALDLHNVHLPESFLKVLLVHETDKQ